MNTKKMGAALAVAIATLTLNGPVLANDACSDTSFKIKYMTDMFICATHGGQWPQAIWQFKGKKGDGCDVHDKLAKLMYVVRDEEPPKPGGKKGKGNNLARGAANDLDDHKFQSAIDQLQLFWDSIEYDAKLNTKNDNADVEADDWQAFAIQMQAEIQGCRTDL